MHFWRPKLGKRIETALRFTFMAGSAVAGLLFAFIVVSVCIMGAREHLPVAMWFVLPLFATFAGFAFYVSQNLWRESFSSSPQRIITKLPAHKLSSIEFYDVATHYFQRRFQVIQICGLFFFFMAVLCVELIFVSQVPWWLDIILGVSSLVCAVIGRAPYRIGKYGVLMIETAQRAGREQQLNALRQLASGLFRGDPVGSFVLKQFAHDEGAA